MKIGVYVGSFNPPHIGHEQVINILINKKIVDKVIIVPTESYWDKIVDVSINDRINMLKFLENDNTIINTTLNNKEYTYQVLNELSHEYSDLYLIIGADNIVSFDKWNNVDQILNHHVIVIGRNNIDINKYLDKFDKSKFMVLNDINYDVSSTFIREKIKNNDFESLKGLVNDKVIDYIKENNLYSD